MLEKSLYQQWFGVVGWKYVIYTVDPKLSISRIISLPFT